MIAAAGAWANATVGNRQKANNGLINHWFQRSGLMIDDGITAWFLCSERIALLRSFTAAAIGTGHAVDDIDLGSGFLGSRLLLVIIGRIDEWIIELVLQQNQIDA